MCDTPTGITEYSQLISFLSFCFNVISLNFYDISRSKRLIDLHHHWTKSIFWWSISSKKIEAKLLSQPLPQQLPCGWHPHCKTKRTFEIRRLGEGINLPAISLVALGNGSPSKVMLVSGLCQSNLRKDQKFPLLALLQSSGCYRRKRQSTCPTSNGQHKNRPRERFPPGSSHLQQW